MRLFSLFVRLLVIGYAFMALIALLRHAPSIHPSIASACDTNNKWCAYCAFTIPRTQHTLRLRHQHQYHAEPTDDMHAINRNGKLNIKSSVNFLYESKMKCFVLPAKVNKRGHATADTAYIEAIEKEDARSFVRSLVRWNFISSFVRWERVLEDVTLLHLPYILHTYNYFYAPNGPLIAVCVCVRAPRRSWVHPRKKNERRRKSRRF